MTGRDKEEEEEGEDLIILEFKRFLAEDILYFYFAMNSLFVPKKTKKKLRTLI
jgi:hypothetical protein